MDVRRGAVTLIVNDLLREGLIFEGATGETVRGRKPTFLYIDSRRRAVIALNAACTHRNVPGVRRHVRAALAAGATRDGRWRACR